MQQSWKTQSAAKSKPQVKWMTLIISLQYNVRLGNLRHVPPTWTPLQNKYSPSRQQQQQPPPAGPCTPPRCKSCSLTAWGTRQRAQGLDLASPRSNRATAGSPEQAWTTEAPLSARRHRTPPEVPCPCPSRSELFWQHEGDLHNKEQVVLKL